MFHGHVGAMDVCARALLIAENMIGDGELAAQVEQRYAGWRGEFGRSVLAGELSLAQVADRAQQRNIDERPVSGRQEFFENLVNRHCEV
jgi:xylose isomerase